MGSDMVEYIQIVRGETHCHHSGYSFYDEQQGIFSMHPSIDRIAHTTVFDKPVVAHWLEQVI